MAHGTRGWEERGGPNPFCAWALEQLGWIGQGNRDLVVVQGEMKEAVFAELRQGGKIYELPTRVPEEYFLVEYRRPGKSYYERDLPGSGLLVWHVQPETENDDEERTLVDLVCADGRYTDFGFPLGRLPAAPETGGENLDFWAHDAEYSRLHRGKLGDGTDLFGGVRYTELSAETNPPAPAGVSVSRIRRQGEAMVADLSSADRRWSAVIEGEVVWQDTVEMVGDVVVPPHTALRISPGTVVLVSPRPRRSLIEGWVRDRVELIVQGGLRAGSPTGAPVRFNSAAAQPKPGDWEGIRVEQSGTA